MQVQTQAIQAAERVQDASRQSSAAGQALFAGNWRQHQQKSIQQQCHQVSHGICIAQQNLKDKSSELTQMLTQRQTVRTKNLPRGRASFPVICG